MQPCKAERIRNASNSENGTSNIGADLCKIESTGVSPYPFN